MRSVFFDKGLGVALGFLVCIVVHHYAHARAAIAMGDRTPRLHGRVSLSIKPHVDTLGTIILPVVWVVVALFNSFFPYVGWGKAQSVQRHLMKRGRAGILITAFAGPVATLVIAIGVGNAAIRQPLGSSAARVLGGIAVVAFLLTVWELLPMPGRDGGRVLAEFLPVNARLKMEELAQYEVLFVIGAFFILQAPIVGIANLLCDATVSRQCSVLLF